MYSTNMYLYPQQHKVLLLNSNDLYNIRWRPVYTKNLRASKGVDNTILFWFLNQDQKPVDVTGMTFTFRLMNREGDKLLLTKELVDHLPERGKSKLILTEAELDGIDTQLANYSVTVNAEHEPVFTDDNAGARGVISIEDAAFPKHIESLEITLPPSMPAESNKNWTEYDETVPTISSQWVPDNSLQTMQYKVTDYEGDIIIQAADHTEGNGHWFDVDTINYAIPTSGTYYINIEGMYPRMRLKFDPATTTGSVDEVLVR